MSATYELYLRWKEAKGIQSDRAGMRALNMSVGVSVHWKNGREAEADVIEKMAKDLGENPALWAARAMAGRTQGDIARAWARIARQLAAVAAVLCLCVIPLHANASTINGLAHIPQVEPMYIMLLARGAGGAGLAGCSSCFNALSNSPGLASGFMRLRTRLVRVDAGTAAFQAVRGLVLAWPAIAAGHFASRLDAILLDAFTPFRPDRRCALLAAVRPASVAG